MVSLSNHLHALGDLGFLVQVQNDASEMASIKTSMARVRVSVSLIASLSTYLGRLLFLHLEYMISTKASSHDSLLSSWKRKDDSVDGGRGENDDFQVIRSEERRVGKNVEIVEIASGDVGRHREA